LARVVKSIGLPLRFKISAMPHIKKEPVYKKF